MSENITTNDNSPEKSYIVNIEKFSGPLDILWNLIKKSKIDITEISISQITEQYIAFLKLMEKMDVKVASEFIMLASELLFYKSRALLPSGDVDDEYFTQPLPPELIEKLLEYKKYQVVSDELKSSFSTQNDVYVRENDLKELGEEEYYFDVSLFDLLKAFSNVLNESVEVDTREIVFDEILVSDKIEHILEMLKEKEQIDFREIFPEQPSRAEIIASFLAILEMSKTRMIRVKQDRNFGDIVIFRQFSLQQLNH